MERPSAQAISVRYVTSQTQWESTRDHNDGNGKRISQHRKSTSLPACSQYATSRSILRKELVKQIKQKETTPTTKWQWQKQVLQQGQYHRKYRNDRHSTGRKARHTNSGKDGNLRSQRGNRHRTQRPKEQMSPRMQVNQQHAIMPTRDTINKRSIGWFDAPIQWYDWKRWITLLVRMLAETSRHMWNCRNSVNNATESSVESKSNEIDG